MSAIVTIMRALVRSYLMMVPVPIVIQFLWMTGSLIIDEILRFKVELVQVQFSLQSVTPQGDRRWSESVGRRVPQWQTQSRCLKTLNSGT